jgi:cation:H+ antiporter
MLLATALLIIGLLLVVYSADRLVYAASILCRMLGIPPLIIGMTVVSIGTSLPEIMVSTAASLHGQTDLAVGTALGSNITNILLILGLAALLRPFTVHSDILRRELPLMLLVSVLAGWCSTMDNCPVSTGCFYWRWRFCGCCLPSKSPVWRSAREAIA